MMISEVEAKVIEVIPRTYNVKSVRVKKVGKIPFKAGQFLSVSLKEGENFTRFLSISNSPTEKDYIEFTKKITESDFSKALDNLRSGDLVKIKYPFGNFTFEGKDKKIAFLSGGIGITPIRSILKYIVDKKIDTDIILIYGNRTPEDIVFKDDFNLMERDYSNLKVCHIISQENSNWQGRKGRINSQIVKEEIPDYKERKFYICGPPAMVEAMKKLLIDDLALQKENILTENFIGY